jgi:hypothetical protein
VCASGVACVLRGVRDDKSRASSKFHTFREKDSEGRRERERERERERSTSTHGEGGGGFLFKQKQKASKEKSTALKTLLLPMCGCGLKAGPVILSLIISRGPVCARASKWTC